MAKKVLLPLLALAISGTALADTESVPPIPGVRAHLRLKAHRVPLGRPIKADFIIENSTGEPITLSVPGTEPDIPAPEAGLPIAHVFSGGNASGVTVTTDSGRRWERPVGYRAKAEAPILMIAPNSMVGTTVDLKEYFPALRGAGEYRIQWRPYGAAVESESVVLTVAPLKQAEIITDDGTMLVQFYYEDAPNTVANFLELADSGFYNGLTFHRLVPGYVLIGGCPQGNGTGRRRDGKVIPAEFNGRPHQKGTLSMALLDGDPDSASCQFFICLTRQREWDGKYTVFGELVGEDSFETLDRLMSVPVDEWGRPTRPLYIRSVRVMDAPVEPSVDTSP